MKVYKFILSALLTGLLCSCQNGEIIDPLINPEKTGYTFDYWYYLDADGQEKNGSLQLLLHKIIN